ncbi:MAG TPA: hypothetical protein VMB72_09435 [Acidimicrobiales bacterium]|nr:hypothetical protein [Acidimicrobiales bacterium]
MTTAAFDTGGRELGFHVAARTVVGRCPAPLNAFEVAVILETCGYTATRARSLGAQSLPDLAQHVFDLVPLYASSVEREAAEPVSVKATAPGLVDLARGFAYSSPWLVSLATLLIAGVSFWSSDVAIPSIANTVTLATAVALLVTGPFIQAFGRRASFYIGLDDQGMVVRITRLTLELGLAATLAACLVVFAGRDLLGAGTPATTRLGIAAGVSIAALQLGLAAFYVRRAFLAIGVVVLTGAGALLLLVARAGSYVDPTMLVVWQIRLVALMAAVCWVMSAWWLLRVPPTDHAPLWRPSWSALGRAVAPYALYGVAFFSLVVLPQLVSCGVLEGRYSFNPVFAMTSGTALVVLVPLLAQTVASTERLVVQQLPAWLTQFTVGEVGGFRERVRQYWRSQLAMLLGLGVVTAAAVLVVAPTLGAKVPLLADLGHYPGLLAASVAGYLLLGTGLFAAQLLFSLSAPMRPLAAGGAGCAALAVGSLATIGFGPTVSATAGLVCGAAAYAVTAVLLARDAFAHADLTYYRTL